MTSFSVKCLKCNQCCELHEIADNQFVLCNDCRNTSKLYSKTFCLKQLLLSKEDLESLKCLYNEKKSANNIKYYLDDDIEYIILNKFNQIQKNKEKKLARLQKLEAQQSLRKEKLTQMLSEHKLECKSFGDCYTYIKYGYPTIETVVSNEIKQSMQLAERKKILYKELLKYNLPYNEKIDSVCYDYINGISSLSDTINEARVENFFIIHTDYPKLNKIYPDEIAKEKALMNYIRMTDESNRHEVATLLIDEIFTISID